MKRDPVCKDEGNHFYQDNAPANRSVLAMGKLKDLRYELLEHPPYSLDMDPSDFYLFSETLSSCSAFFIG